MTGISKNLLTPQGFLVVAGTAGLLAGDFLMVSPNRLLPGEPAPTGSLILMVLFTGMLGLLPFTRKQCFPFLVAAVSGLFLLLLGTESNKVLLMAGEYSRVSPGGAFWIPAICLFLILLEGMMEEGQKALRRILLMLVSFALPGLFLTGGLLNSLSVVTEFLQVREQFLAETLRHLALSAGATAVSVILGVPLGYGMSVGRIPSRPVFYALNLIQTIPGLALFTILMTFLGFLTNLWPVLETAGVRGIGWPPAFLALVLYGLFAVVRTSYESFSAVDAVHKHAAAGLGLNHAQIFLRLKLPLAAGGIVNGIRLTLVMNIGMATVTALIGAGGLGRFIFTGLGQAAYDLVLLGSLAVVGIALLADISMRLIAPASGKGKS